MKKLLTTAFCVSMLFVGTQAVMAADNAAADKQPPKMERMHKPKKPNLEEYLNLTEKQKAQAKANRIAGRKEMKPIMDEIRTKKEAILDIMDSDLTKEQQQEKIKPIQQEIKALYKKSNEMREANMKKFEKILTKEQKAKFEQMKKKHGPKCKNCERRMPPPPMESEK